MSDTEAIACPSCGATVGASAKFCPKCGTPLAGRAVDEVLSGQSISATNSPSPMDTPTEGLPPLVGRDIYKRFVRKPQKSLSDGEGFVILSKNLLSQQERMKGSFDETIDGISRNRLASNKLPTWNPLPPVSQLVTRSSTGGGQLSVATTEKKRGSRSRATKS